MTKEENFKFKPMKEYKPSEREFVVFEERDIITWAVVPKDVVRLGYYKDPNGPKFSLVEVLAINSFTFAKDYNGTQSFEKAMGNLLKDGFSFSEKMSEMISEVGYNVYWIH